MLDALFYGSLVFEFRVYPEAVTFEILTFPHDGVCKPPTKAKKMGK
jgi:hypothetical protein